MIGVAAAWLVVAGFLVIGAATFPFPALASQAYGTPVADAAGRALVSALGLRDLALGLALALDLLRGDTEAAAGLMAVTALVALVDFGIVYRHNGRLVPQLVVHAGGFALGVGGAVLLALHR